MKTKYSLDKELKDVGGFWARMDFRDFIITPTKVGMINAYNEAYRLLRPPIKGVSKYIRKIKASGGGKMKVIVYEPDGMKKDAPCLIYYHGGAFILKEDSSSHKLAQYYALSVPCKVIIVDYRLAMDYPYPTPVKDCYRALQWVEHNADALGIDRKRIAVIGDNAGGSLAAAVALLARDLSGPKICFQMLISPVTDCRMTTWSMRQFVDSPRWNSNLNRQMWKYYLRKGDCGRPEYASPLQAASLADLPPAYVETQEIDCLRDEGNAYADRLCQAGVPVELNEIRGTFNSYDVFDKNTLVRLSLKRRCMVLKKAFERTI